MLREKNWIDGFTKAVAVKWTVFHRWDKKFYSITLICETPGLNIKECNYNLEVVSFLERSFEASVDEQG